MRERLQIIPNIVEGVYPFKDIRLSRADIEWLLHHQRRVNWIDESQQERREIDLRGSDHDEAERIATPIIETIAQRHQLICKKSKLAIEIYPPIHTNKGEGIRRLIKSHKLKSVVYLGDDISDTDAFIEIQRLRSRKKVQGIAIGVLHDGYPVALIEHADLIVNERHEVIPFLTWLIQHLAK